MSETEDFLKDLDVKQDDVFDKPIVEEAEVKETTETTEESEQKLKNRRERRLSEKLQREREANIALSTRLQTISESQTLRETPDADYVKRIEKIYGNATPEAKEATELLKEAFAGVTQYAKEEALKEFESRRTSESDAVAKEERELDDILDSVEDEHGIDMSGDDRKGFLTLLEKLSPKDEDGNIKEYADPNTTAEMFISLREKQSSGRAKELASRGMTRSGSTQAQAKAEVSEVERILRENGIID